MFRATFFPPQQRICPDPPSMMDPELLDAFFAPMGARRQLRAGHRLKSPLPFVAKGDPLCPPPEGFRGATKAIDRFFHGRFFRKETSPSGRLSNFSPWCERSLFRLKPTDSSSSAYVLLSLAHIQHVLSIRGFFLADSSFHKGGNERCFGPGVSLLRSARALLIGNDD